MNNSLLGYTAFKVGKLLVIMILVSVISFTLVSLSPLDPITAYLGVDRMQISQEQQALIINRWGLDQPPVDRFFIWAGRIFQGDFGRSMIFNQPVISVIGQRFMASLWLMGAAWVLSGVLGFVLGIIAGAWKNSLADRVIRLYAFTLASTPTFWMGLVLLVAFAVKLDWAPFCCAGPPGVLPQDITLGQRLHHLILPAATLSIIGTAAITMHTREKMIDVMNSDHALFARAQGESTLGLALSHGVRNVSLPALTLQFATIGELFGGSVLAEQVFSYPGLGQAVVQAGTRGDVPLLLGIVLFSTLFVCCGNALADLLYRAVDPRIRLGEGCHA